MPRAIGAIYCMKMVYLSVPLYYICIIAWLTAPVLVTRATASMSECVHFVWPEVVLCSVTFWWQSCACNRTIFCTCTSSGSPHNVMHSSSHHECAVKRVLCIRPQSNPACACVHGLLHLANWNFTVQAISMATVCTALVFLLFMSPLCSWGFPRVGLQGMPKTPPKREGVKLAPAQWFQQKLDHFNPSDALTWKQRYFVNDTNWDRDYGPVFLMIYGEGEADPVWLVDSDIMRNAEKFKALVILLEHRYVPAFCIRQ